MMGLEPKSKSMPCQLSNPEIDSLYGLRCLTSIDFGCIGITEDFGANPGTC